MRQVAADHPIAQLLRERNLQIHDLTAGLGCSERLIYYWINGKRTISPAYLARLSDFFHLPPETFRARNTHN